MDVGQTGKNEKHVAINQSLNILHESISRMKDLHERIIGEGEHTSKADEAVKSVAGPLVVVLNESSSIITSCAERIDTIREQIEEALF